MEYCGDKPLGDVFLEKRSEFKKRIGRSPDSSDAFTMGWFTNFTSFSGQSSIKPINRSAPKSRQRIQEIMRA